MGGLNTHLHNSVTWLYVGTSMFSGGSRNFDRGVPNHPNHKVGGGQNLCFSKQTLFFFFFFSFFHIFTFSVHISSASSMEVIKKKKKKGYKKKGKKKFRKNKVSLHRLVPGPLTLMDIGRSGDTLRMNSK